VIISIGMEWVLAILMEEDNGNPNGEISTKNLPLITIGSLLWVTTITENTTTMLCVLGR